MWGRDVSVNLLASDFKALSVSLGKYKWMVDTLLCDCAFSLVALKLLNMYERKGIKERTNEKYLCTRLECFALSQGEERHVRDGGCLSKVFGGHGFVYNE